MVAAKAGISQTLVSIVLGGGKASVEVADATREKIIAAARDLGYEFKSNISRKRVLALVMPVLDREDPTVEPWIYDARDEFYAKTHLHVADCALRKGYSLIVRPHENATDLTHWLIEWGVDGVIWHGPDGELLRWVAERFPTVLLHYSSQPHIDCVTANQEEIATLALNHLYEAGHHRIAMAPGVPASKSTRMRINAFRDRAEELGLPVYESLFEVSTHFGPGGLIERIVNLLQGDNPPTALIAGDTTALLIAREAMKMGLVVPADLSLVGIDNMAAGALHNPALTSIDVRQKEVSEAAINLLSNRMENRTLSYQKIFLNPILVTRQSVQAPARHPRTASSRRKTSAGGGGMI